MPALNMGSPAVPAANPSTGRQVIMNPFSGPKGSLFDATMFHPTTGVKTKDPNNFSTGAMSTGIGFGLNTGPVINVSTGTDAIPPITGPERAIDNAGFTDDVDPGLDMPANTLAVDARLLAIGGGRNVITGGGNTGLGVSNPSPYAAQPILAFGNGASRDAGAGPAFTGFGMKMVTATGAVADGAAIEAGYTNRTGRAMVATDSAFGSSTTASPAIT